MRVALAAIGVGLVLAAIASVGPAWPHDVAMK